MSLQIPAPRSVVEGRWIYVAAVVCDIVAGVYIGRTGSLVPLLAIAAVAAILVAVAMPGFAVVVGLAAMAVPYTWGPQVPKLGFGSGIVVGLLLAAAYAPTLMRFRPNALDLAVLAFAITPAAIAAWEGEAFHITNWLAPAVTLPYFGFRLLFDATDVRRLFAPALIWIGVIVSLVGIWEGLTGRNPIMSPGIVTYGSSGHYVTSWNVQDYRDGHLRALSTFGHPIAFGMFLLIPLAFALARGGRWNLAAAGIFLIAEALTYSRGPWAGALVVLVLLAGRSRGRILAFATVLIVGAVFVGPVNRVLIESGSASTEAGTNTYYRIGLLTRAFHDMSVLGHPFTDLQSAIPNYPDVTSLLAGTIIQTGLVGVVELALIAWLAILALVHARRRTDPDYHAAAAALTAQFVGLLSVTLITNYQFFFWALVAYVATGGAGARSERPARSESSTVHVRRGGISPPCGCRRRRDDTVTTGRG